MKVHHIGYLVEDIQEGIDGFTLLGYTRSPLSPLGAVRDEDRGLFICFMQKDGLLAELISPLHESSAISGLLKKRGAGAYHICYESEDLQKAIETLAGQGYMVIAAPAPAVALKGKSVAFLYDKNTGILELLQK